jgi:hypothetical protein
VPHPGAGAWVAELTGLLDLGKSGWSRHSASLVTPVLRGPVSGPGDGELPLWPAEHELPGEWLTRRAGGPDDDLDRA